ncbi:MAG: MBL fold metallo-hydrolase [Candidatus Marinimicrobia bacterium]|nr:MBL fold metallo-hydrolase [Candidatus Neomarinimicrobiota bacterium]
MKITFYGTRGSIPVPEPDYVEFGGNTACILLTFNTGRIAIIDAGTGIRKLGNDLIEQGHQQFDDIVLGLSHTHWDHIQGFPFFKPAYDSRRHFTISIGGRDHTNASLESIFAAQMEQEYFPIPLHGMGARFDFWQPDPNAVNDLRGIKLKATELNHPGGAFGYRIEEDGKSIVYCTDVEHGPEIDQRVVELAFECDLLIHDAQYTPAELNDKKGWGHSSWEQAAEVADLAKVERLVLFHHDPEHNDAFLKMIEKDCRSVFRNTVSAREGMTIDI